MFSTQVTIHHDNLILGVAKNTSCIMRKEAIRMLNGKVIKAISVIATVGGAALGILGSWATEKQNEAKIAEKATEAVAKLLEKES